MLDILDEKTLYDEYKNNNVLFDKQSAQPANSSKKNNISQKIRAMSTERSSTSALPVHSTTIQNFSAVGNVSGVSAIGGVSGVSGVSGVDNVSAIDGVSNLDMIDDDVPVKEVMVKKESKKKPSIIDKAKELENGRT